MFFVADINGNLHAYAAPLLPGNVGSGSAQPIDRTALATSGAPLSPSGAVLEQTAIESASAAELIAETNTGEPQDAAVFEGHTPAVGGLLSSDLAAGAGVAASVMAYRAASSMEIDREPEASADHEAVDEIVPSQESGTAPRYMGHRGELPAHDRVQPIRERQKEPSSPDTFPALLAGQVMTSPVLTLNEHDTVQSALAMFESKRFRHIPVLSRQGKLIGLLSDRDFLPFAHGNSPEKALDIQRPVRDFMTSDVLTARPEADLRSIARIMFDRRISSMPIVDDAGRLLGLITANDILRAAVLSR
ncbi:MAG: CBS domain-containing protein [Bdellovibrionota bacterium]